MIKNDRQLSITGKWLEELTARLERLKSKYRRKAVWISSQRRHAIRSS